ncbi:MAG: 4Fe-4S binding protein, partial [Bacteroidales bacterium]
MKREIIHIDEEKCTGCGECIPGCHEGALQLIDGKARLISDLMCDGLGACIGHCPEGAIRMEKREAEPYDEVTVMKEMVKKGKNVVVAHLKHLKEHNQKEFLKKGVQYLADNKSSLDFDIMEVLAVVHNAEPAHDMFNKEPTVKVQAMHHEHKGGCPGSKAFAFDEPSGAKVVTNQEEVQSHLTHWPVQMHLINPMAPYFQGSDLLFSADCVAHTLGNFHGRFLKGKTLVIACPKLDSQVEVYVEKLQALIDQAEINTITVMVMEVPCCKGLLQLAKTASGRASRKVPVKSVTVGIRGDILA